MPIYEYLCDACGEKMEKLQRMNDDRLVDCPACGKPALKRLISAVAFRLKGSGWYETDFKKDNKRNLADSGSNDSSGSSSETGGGASDSKGTSDSSSSGSSSSDSSSSDRSTSGSDSKKTSKPAEKSSSD